MEVYAQDKWKLSKKESRSRRSTAEGTAAAASASAAAAGPSFLKSSASTREGRRTTASTPPAPETMPRSFSSRCSSLVKEQRARFYIVRRCVTMLVCWRDYP